MGRVPSKPTFVMRLEPVLFWSEPQAFDRGGGENQSRSLTDVNQGIEISFPILSAPVEVVALNRRTWTGNPQDVR